MRKDLESFNIYMNSLDKMQFFEPEEEIELLREAYRDSYKDFGGWLDGSKPLFIKDIISLRNFAKRIYHKLKH